MNQRICSCPGVALTKPALSRLAAMMATGISAPAGASSVAITPFKDIDEIPGGTIPGGGT